MDIVYEEEYLDPCTESPYPIHLQYQEDTQYLDEPPSEKKPRRQKNLFPKEIKIEVNPIHLQYQEDTQYLDEPPSEKKPRRQKNLFPKEIKIEVNPIHRQYQEDKNNNSQEDTQYLDEPPSEKKPRRQKNLVPKEIKVEVNRLIKSYPFMYEKSHKLYRNQTKRDAVWHEIATQLNISVPQVKTAWKSIKDSHRSQGKKSQASGKSGDAAPDDIDDVDEQRDDDELDLTYLKKQDSSLYRETVSLGGGSTFKSPNTIDLTDQSETPKSSQSQTSRSYSYMDRNKRGRNNAMLDTMKTISETMTTLVTQDSSNESSSMLKRHAMWAGLENMMQYLSENEIVDLNASFINQIHSVILANRAKNNPTQSSAP